MIEQRANDQLQKAAEQLEHVARHRPLRGARGRASSPTSSATPRAAAASRASFKVAADYFNPFFAALREGRMSGAPGGPPPAGQRAPATEGGH